MAAAVRVQFVLKRMFFTTDNVTKALDRAARRVLSKFGAYVRTAARSSIRKRKKPSKAGRPPHSHGGQLRKGILFGYDGTRQSVVVGPVPFHSKVARRIPVVLEEGGRTLVMDHGKNEKRQVKIEPRPFMGPAFRQEHPKLPEMWRDAI